MEEFTALCILILTDGFITDANLPGVERLAVMIQPDSAFLDRPPTKLPPLHEHSHALSCLHFRLLGSSAMFLPSSESVWGKLVMKKKFLAEMLLYVASGDILPPFSIAFVKGWRRSLAALICAEGVRALNINVGDLSTKFKDAALRFFPEFVLPIQFLVHVSRCVRVSDFNIE